MTICAPRIRPCNLLREYRCANKKCIDKTRVCDHVDDCGDQSDELGCHDKSSCVPPNNGNCEHRCVNLMSGYICACNHGYIISKTNPKFCEDINECESVSLNNCTQGCVNLKGEFCCLIE